VLRQQTDLKIEIGALVRCRRHPVLCDEHESRKKDGFYGREHGENDERGIPGRDARQPAQIGDDPEPEKSSVDIDKRPAAGEPRDDIGECWAR
jgi:hypothetical protein